MSRIEGQAPLESIIPGLTPSHQADHAKKAPSQDTGKAGKDEVDVSSRAKNLNRIAASLEMVPVIRVDKVSAI